MERTKGSAPGPDHDVIRTVLIVRRGDQAGPPDWGSQGRGPGRISLGYNSPKEATPFKATYGTTRSVHFAGIHVPSAHGGKHIPVTADSAPASPPQISSLLLSRTGHCFVAVVSAEERVACTVRKNAVFLEPLYFESIFF